MALYTQNCPAQARPAAAAAPSRRQFLKTLGTLLAAAQAPVSTLGELLNQPAVAEVVLSTNWMNIGYSLLISDTSRLLAGVKKAEAVWSGGDALHPDSSFFEARVAALISNLRDCGITRLPSEAELTQLKRCADSLPAVQKFLDTPGVLDKLIARFGGADNPEYVKTMAGHELQILKLVAGHLPQLCAGLQEAALELNKLRPGALAGNWLAEFLKDGTAPFAGRQVLLQQMVELDGLKSGLMAYQDGVRQLARLPYDQVWQVRKLEACLEAEGIPVEKLEDQVQRRLRALERKLAFLAERAWQSEGDWDGGARRLATEALYESTRKFEAKIKIKSFRLPDIDGVPCYIEL